MMPEHERSEEKVRTGSGSDRVMRQARHLDVKAFLVLDYEGPQPVATTTPRGLPARGPRPAPGSDFALRKGESSMDHTQRIANCPLDQLE
jgi:hypothetical protein